MENDEPRYEVKPLPVLVRRGTPPWCGKFLQVARHVGLWVVLALVIGCLLVWASVLLEKQSHPAPASEVRTAIVIPEANPPSTGAGGNANAQRAREEPSEGHPFWPSFRHHLVQELAVAFLVSAIVIFAFEWGSETKHSLDLAGQLANTLTTHIDDVLNASATQAIANAMRKLAGAKSEDFLNQFRSLAGSIEQLSDGGWAAQGYLEFMQWYHSEFTGYAESLAHLSEKVSHNARSKTEFRLVLPEATTPIDVMLARITHAMKSCGAYYAISDMFTWTKLSDFHTAQRVELRNGLQIRRIFVFGKASDVGVSARDVSEHMYDHYAEATKSDCNYRIKLISQADFHRLAATTLTKTEHFGIFKPTDPQKLPIIVQVLDAQLLTFRIAGTAEANAVLDAFKDLWKRLDDVENCGPDDPAIDDRNDPNNGNGRGNGIRPAPENLCDGAPSDGASTHQDSASVSDDAKGNAKAGVPDPRPRAANSDNPDKPSGTDMIRDQLMAYRMRQLPRSQEKIVWYHGASKIELWISGAVREFEQAVLEAAEDGIEIKRLFIFKRPSPEHLPELNDKILQTLRKHAEISRGRPNYQWRVIAEDLLHEDLRQAPFALFREEENVEVARGDDTKFGFGASKAVASQLEEGFEENWESFRSTPSASVDAALMTLISDLDTTIRKERDEPLSDDLRQLKETVENLRRKVEHALRRELITSIEILWKNEAQRVIDFIGPSRPKRTTADQDPQGDE